MNVVGRRILGMCMGVSLLAACAESAPTSRVYDVTSRSQFFVVQGATDTVPVSQEVRASFQIDRMGPDSLEAWFTQLLVARVNPAMTDFADTDSLLNQRFVLREGSGGRIEIVSTPELPSIAGDLPDLRRQFDSFFPAKVPSPLAVGATWTDTVSFREEEPNASAEGVDIIEYEVTGTESIDGESVFVISASAQATVETRVQQPGTPELIQAFSGTYQGTLNLRESDRVMIRRGIAGSLSGSVAVPAVGIELDAFATLADTAELRSAN